VSCVPNSHLIIATTQNEKVEEGIFKRKILLMKVEHPENMLVSLSAVSLFD
jgi:hypothetical protein